MERFREKVRIDESGCHLWTGGLSRHNGYAVFSAPGEGRRGRNFVPVTGHRWIWEQLRGPIPEGMFICHHCDTPPCVNIDHLYVGTPKQNSDDKFARGRYAYGGRPGESAASATFRDADVTALRKEYAARPFDIPARASELGINHWNIRHALTGSTYGHLPNPVKLVNPHLRLTDDEVRALRAERAAAPFNVTQRARDMGLDVQVLYGVLSGKRYKHVV